MTCFLIKRVLFLTFGPQAVVCAKAYEPASRRVVFSALAAVAVSAAVLKPAMALTSDEQIRRRNCDSTRAPVAKICGDKKKK
jgi:hypothetical protein